MSYYRYRTRTLDLNWIVCIEDSYILNIELTLYVDHEMKPLLEFEDKELAVNIGYILDGLDQRYNINKEETKLLFVGGEFDKKVWQEIYKIPYGQTITYKQLAEKVGKPKAYRAVANACGRNPILIMIPCHRVVGTNNLGGFRYGVEVKKKLLQREQDGKS